MKIGALFNAGAGGAASFPAIGEALLSRFGDFALVTCAESFGGTWLSGVPSCQVPDLPYILRLRRAVTLLVEAGIDLLVCAGGDGFASYCAEALILLGAKIPLLGVAGGTANVGPLVRFDAAKLARLPQGEPEIRTVHALECSCFCGDDGGRGATGSDRDGRGSRVLGLAFNDIVIGDTFLGTLDGRMVNLSVKDFLADGRKTERIPSQSVVGPSFRVKLNGAPIPFRCAPVQIIAAPLNDSDFYKGKAVTGALCSAPWQGSCGALALCDRVWVSMESSAAGFCATEHLLFAAGDRVELEGLADDGQVVIDGNPFFRSGGTVAISCRPDVLKVVQSR